MKTDGQLLPPHAREALQRAAQTPITEQDQLARVRAINETIERLKRSYPECFREEPCSPA